MILGIDPGTRTSGAVLWCERTQRAVWSDQSAENGELLERLRRQMWDGEAWVPDAWVGYHHDVVIEALSPRGLVIGWEVFGTVEWSGRFREAAEYRRFEKPMGGTYSVPHRVERPGSRSVNCIHRDDIVIELLGRKVKAPDSHLREYLLHKLGPKGTKLAPGPTFGVAGHAWQALAAVQCYRERLAENAA